MHLQALCTGSWLFCGRKSVPIFRFGHAGRSLSFPPLEFSQPLLFPEAAEGQSGSVLRPHCVSAGFLTHDPWTSVVKHPPKERLPDPPAHRILPGRWQFGKWQLEPEVLRCLGCFYFSFTCTRSLSVSSTTELGPYVLPSPVVSTSPRPGLALAWVHPACSPLVHKVLLFVGTGLESPPLVLCSSWAMPRPLLLVSRLSWRF